jgi:hypothetical protein
MKFQYVGCGIDDPQTTKIYGYEFELHGDVVEVDGKAAKKLVGNATFIEVYAEKSGIVETPKRRGRPPKTEQSEEE